MKIALLMSGGVDSSYCAYLLKKMGYEVVGIYLKLHDKEEKHQIFIQNCHKVSSNLGIEFHIIEAQKEFKQKVYDEFILSYKKGETPNPCALCNPLMKFGLALQRARAMGCEKIATGHYARIGEINGRKRIREALDPSKDQSYFLYALSQSAIDDLLFPLGDYLKVNIKKEAFEAMPWLGSLETYKESQEICFVETDYIDILKKTLEVEQKGIVRNLKGEIVGEHKGYMQYTIGKRKGFSVKGALTPHYVLSIDAEKNEIVVGEKEDLATTQVKAINKSLEGFESGEYEIKIRYRSQKSKAYVKLEENGSITATLKEPVYGVAKGQALVVYERDCVLGGGVIV